MICYGGYRQLQDIRESIDKQLNDPKARWQKGMKELWTALRGNGMPDDGNILYGSIYETPPERETIVGMQGKLLHMLVVLQSADTRPTASAVSAVEKLAQSTQGLIRRWETLRK